MGKKTKNRNKRKCLSGLCSKINSLKKEFI